MKLTLDTSWEFELVDDKLILIKPEYYDYTKDKLISEVKIEINSIEQIANLFSKCQSCLQSHDRELKENLENKFKRFDEVTLTVPIVIDRKEWNQFWKERGIE